MLPSLRALNAEAGPSRPRPPPYVPRNVERTYTGPDPASLPPKRDRSQAEKYFARVSNENILPSKWSKVIGIGGWVVGGCESSNKCGECSGKDCGFVQQSCFLVVAQLLRASNHLEVDIAHLKQSTNPENSSLSTRAFVDTITSFIR